MAKTSVEATLRELVEHYSQPVHEQSFDTAAPYFDSLLGHAPVLSPVTKHWLGRLQDHDACKIEWMCGYPTHIRPALMRAHRLELSGIPVLQQYELVLSQWKQDPTPSDSTNLSEALVKVASDISSLTEMEDEQDVCRNMVLPTLIRLLAHGIPWLKDMETKRTCAVTLFCFTSLTLSPRDLMDDKCFSTLTYPDSPNDMCTVELGDWIDWKSVELSSATWNDPVSGIGKRAAQYAWTCFSTNNDDIPTSVVMQQLGVAKMAAAVRAHFFGRTTSSTVSNTNMTRQYPLEFQPVRMPNESFLKRPSRMHAALYFIQLLDAEKLSLDEQGKVLQELLPIAYALLDATPLHAAHGAAALLKLYTFQADAFCDYKDTLLHALELACRVTRQGPAVALVCRAQSRVFTVFPKCRRERLQTTRQLLVHVQKNSYAQHEELLLGLLVGGVIPLLQQQDDLLEVGRLGLMALLPLVRFTSTRLQLAACVALIHLVLGAHSIMPRHGGKIMCEVLAMLGYCEDEQVTSVAIRTAAVALIICGKRAEEILDRVETGDYQPILVQHAQDIRKEANFLEKKE